MVNTQKQETGWRKPEAVSPHARKGMSWWVARAAGTGDYFGWETNEGTAWVPLAAAFLFASREEAAVAVSVPVSIEVCQIDIVRNIISIENPNHKQ